MKNKLRIIDINDPIIPEKERQRILKLSRDAKDKRGTNKCMQFGIHNPFNRVTSIEQLKQLTNGK